MIHPSSKLRRLLLLAGALLAAGAVQAQSQAQSPAPAQPAAAVRPDPGTLRICASEAEAPFSLKDGQGFENRIGAVLAEAMGRKAAFVWTSKPAIYQVRDQLDAGLCDVVLGVDTGDARMLTSEPYYRTSYVLVTRADRNITATDWQDPAIAGLDRFAIRFYSPGETMLKRLGKYEDNASYLSSLVNFKSPRNQYVQVPADRLVTDVADGKADVAIAFAPEVARYVKAATPPLRMSVISTPVIRFDGTVVPLHYDQSVGVRRDDAKLLTQVDAALKAARPRIEAILAEEGIPLLKPNT